MSRTRVLIIDDHERVRAALLAKLERDGDLEVTGTAASSDRDLEEALRFEPDVVLLDVKRGDGGGIEICRKIVRERPSTRVLVLTSYPDEREKGETQAMGAVGYLLKDLDLQELLQQIKVPQGSGMHGNLRGAE
jgi:DNA-binding NarL/FixJ family response regulator